MQGIRTFRDSARFPGGKNERIRPGTGLSAGDADARTDVSPTRPDLEDKIHLFFDSLYSPSLNPKYSLNNVKSSGQKEQRSQALPLKPVSISLSWR